MDLINLQNINVSYDKKNNILENLNLKVKKGELVSLLGPSGCGKTTLLRYLLPSLRPKGNIDGVIILDDDIENDDEEDAQEEEPIETPAQGRKSAKLRNDDYIEKKINKAKSVLEKQYTKNTYTPDKTSKEQHKSAGALLMPRQIKKGLKYFREVKPFVSDYIDNTRWWKIEINPTTMCGYTMPYLGYINSLNYTMYSDAVMQSYKYRHYLFGVKYDEYNKRQYYIYAVPGKKAEQPDKGHTGFTRYQPCDTRNTSLGYWLCFVDCKARKIVK